MYYIDPISHEMHVLQQFNMVIGWNFSKKSSVLVTPSVPKIQVTKFLDMLFLYDTDCISTKLADRFCQENFLIAIINDYQVFLANLGQDLR